MSLLKKMGDVEKQEGFQRPLMFTTIGMCVYVFNFPLCTYG